MREKIRQGGLRRRVVAVAMGTALLAASMASRGEAQIPTAIETPISIDTASAIVTPSATYSAVYRGSPAAEKSPAAYPYPGAGYSTSTAAQTPISTASQTPTASPSPGVGQVPGAQQTPTMAPGADVSPNANADADAIEIEVVGLRSDQGEVGCSLFNDPTGFPRDDSKILRQVWAPVAGRKALCKFSGFAPGQYAAVVFHDENGNHQFDENAFGMPEEGYGFSNDAAALFSPPTFESAAFTYTGTALYQIVNIRY